jgi:hypothetical protein
LIPASTTITPEGRRIGNFLLICGLVVVVGNLLALMLRGLGTGSQVTGPAGSSYVTTAFGTAAWTALLESEGIEVSRLRAPYQDRYLPVDSTLVLVGPGWTSFARSELAAVRRFVEGSGWLVVAGPAAPALFEALSETPPRWVPEGPTQAEADQSLGDVGQVPLSGRGSLVSTARASVLLFGEGKVAALEWGLGAGRIRWLADPTPLLNTGLAEGDSAGLSIALTGGRPVIFDEFRHGFGGDTFWQSLPDGWNITLMLLGVAGLAGLVAYGRRSAPVETERRRLQPERAEFVRSVAAIMGRSGRLEEAAEPVRRRARHLLMKRSGIGAAATAEDLAATARMSGLGADEFAAVMDPAGDPMVAGRALARLSKRS